MWYMPQDRAHLFVLKVEASLLKNLIGAAQSENATGSRMLIETNKR